MKDALKRFALWLVEVVIGITFLACFAFLLVEWASGCGESYVDSKGVRHNNPCTLTTTPPQPQPPTTTKP